MNIDVELIEKVVKKVLNDVETGSCESEYGYGILILWMKQSKLPQKHRKNI